MGPHPEVGVDVDAKDSQGSDVDSTRNNHGGGGDYFPSGVGN